MKTITQRFAAVMIVGGLLVSQAGCSVLDMLRPAAEGEPSGEETQSGPDGSKDPADAPQNGDQAANADGVNEEAAYLACPQEGEYLTLGFDHTLTMNYESASMTHILKSGSHRMNLF